MRSAMNQSTVAWNSSITMTCSQWRVPSASRKRTRHSRSVKRLRKALSISSVGSGSNVLKSIRSIRAAAPRSRRGPQPTITSCTVTALPKYNLWNWSRRRPASGGVRAVSSVDALIASILAQKGSASQSGPVGAKQKGLV